MADRGALIAAAVDALPTSTTIVDRGGTIRYTNGHWLAFGRENDLEPDAIDVGTNYLEVCDRSDDEDAVGAARGIRSVLEGEADAFSLEYPCHSPEERRWFTMRAVPFDHDGERFALLVHLDVTERRLMEERVREQAERSADLARMLSHDLRNPLSVAMAELATVEGEEGGDDRLASIASSLERMETIVDDALGLLKTDVGEARPVDLEGLAEDAWSHVETVDATLVIDGDLSIEANPGLAETLLENLFGNAVDHGPAEVTVRVGPLEESMGDGEPVGFYVEDDGPGIPAENRDRVFETGYSTTADGTGFGLAIVRRVASVQGWSVTVTEGRDDGARFEVTRVSTGSTPGAGEP